MKQQQFSYTDDSDLQARLEGVRQHLGPDAKVLVQVFCDCWADDQVKSIRNTVKGIFPESVFTGSASFGNIVDGDISVGTIVLVVTVFESASTKIEGLYYAMDTGEAAEVAHRLVAEVEARPWVRAVEALVMNNGESMDGFCEAMEDLREDVQVFGGMVHFGHAPDAPKFVVDDGGDVLRWGAAFVLIGGDDFHIETRHIRGWKPLGTEMRATRCTANLLHELNGRPAHELYKRYLNIENDENFFFNVLEFPFLYKTGDVEVLRTPIACLDDGSMVLAAPVPEGSPLRIAYGDPEEILKTVKGCGDEIAEYRPDVIMLFPCGVRRTFWSDAGVNRETGPFQTVASTGGLFVAGELLRQGKRLIEFNSTLIVVAMREGDADAKPPASFDMPAERRQRKSLVSRFAFFIDAAMTEIEESYGELEALNATLEKLSVTDGLTGLLNRREIESRIRSGCDENDGSLYVIMMDLDDFKQVNDVYGHHEGDVALESFSDLLRRLADAAEAQVEVGRWGGEEFILFASTDDSAKVDAFAEAIRNGFEEAPIGKHYRHTVSIGVTRVRRGESADSAISRADEAMYAAKQGGKNQVVVLD